MGRRPLENRQGLTAPRSERQQTERHGCSNAEDAVKNNDPDKFHQMYGKREPRVSYYPRDFLDYCMMILLTAVVIAVSYGPRHVLTIAGVVMCAFMVATFIVRHGVKLTVPVLLRRPQEVFYAIVYKLRNLKPVYFVAVAVLLLENVLIAATPALPHHTAGMRTAALWLFYLHIAAITLFRMRILVDHIRKRTLVREVLMQTAWKRVVGGKTNMTIEVLHAFATGVLTHIVLVAPWYLIITRLQFSIIFLPAVLFLNIVAHAKWLKTINAWFYRDHWLGHNSEVDFLFLHGTHHDAIPSGLIAVAENGLLEGFLRFTVGSPVPFYNPLVSFLAHTLEVYKDIEAHQYIPGVYPQQPLSLMEVSQHSTHHYGPIAPYSFAIRVDHPSAAPKHQNMFRGLPDELRNSAKLDEELTGFEWDNPTHRRTLELFAKYQA
jgi:hypothetical protein